MARRDTDGLTAVFLGGDHPRLLFRFSLEGEAGPVVEVKPRRLSWPLRVNLREQAAAAKESEPP